MSEPNAVDRFFYTVLTGDAAFAAIVGTRVFSDVAPQTTPPTPMPLCIFSMLSAVDLRTIGIYRVWSNMLFLVKVIAETNSFGGNLKTGADRIDAVLHAASGSNVDGVIYAIVRERPFRLTETVDGRTFRHAGSILRVYAKAA